MKYEVIVKNITGTEIFSIPFTKFRLTQQLNHGVDGSISTSHNAMHQYAEALKTTENDILTAKLREVEIRRNGDTIFVGVLNKRVKDLATGSITLWVRDYVGMLVTRYTAKTKSYTSMDSADIAWDLINTTQSKPNGDWGITRGLAPTTKDRNRTFHFEDLLSAVVGMSNAKVKDGYDFEIDHTKKFNIYYPTKGSTKDNIVFDERNIVSGIDTINLAGKIANKVIVLGKGSESDMATAEVEDTTSQATWLLHEFALAEKGVATVSELTDRGNSYLEQHNEPTDSRTLTIQHIDGHPDLTAYNLGDKVKIRIKTSGVDSLWRVVKRTLNFDGSHLTIQLELEQ